MSRDLRTLTAGFVASSIALMVLSWVASTNNIVVVVVWFGAIIVGSAAWSVGHEHRSLRSLLRRDPSVPKSIRRIDFLAFVAAWISIPYTRTVWPSRLEIPVDTQGTPIPPSVIYFDHLLTFDLSDNVSRTLVLWMAIYVGTLALGRAALVVADRARRASQRIGTRHAV